VFGNWGKRESYRLAVPRTSELSVSVPTREKRRGYGRRRFLGLNRFEVLSVSHRGTPGSASRRSAKGLLLAAVVVAVAASAIPSARAAVAAVRAVSLGPCTPEVAAEPRLARVSRGMVKVPGFPFGVSAARRGWVFVSGYGRTGGYVAVLSEHGVASRLVRVVDVPVSLALGSGLTPDGRYLIVAGQDPAAWKGPHQLYPPVPPARGSTQAIVLSVSRLEAGLPHSVLGVLKAPITLNGFRVNQAVEVTLSKDGRFAFVAEEGPSKVAVFDLRRALATRFASSGYVGSVPLAQGVVGMTLSPDGRTLYAISKEGQNSSVQHESNPQQLRLSYGTLSVIDVGKAESQPRHAVVSVTAAGCDARRVAVSPDGTTVWTTAAGSDQLLAFSSQKLIHDPKHALLAAIRVGAQPFGVTTFDDGQRIAVCDASNAHGSISGITIVDAKAALDGAPSLIGDIPAGVFPRNLTVEPNGTTLLATNFGSGQLEAVDLQHLG
jgi:hypothetical protein